MTLQGIWSQTVPPTDPADTSVLKIVIGLSLTHLCIQISGIQKRL